MQIILYFLLDNSSNLPPLQDDREEFQLQTEDILRERFELKNSSTGIVKYIYSHELDQDILNLHVEIKYIWLHLNKYNILYSHSFQLLPILFYRKHEMFSVFIFVALLKYSMPKQFYDDLVNSICFIICFNYCILFSNYISHCFLFSLSLLLLVVQGPSDAIFNQII